MSLEWLMFGFLMLAFVIVLMIVGVLLLGYRLLKSYPAVSDPDAPGSLKTVFWLAVLYVVSPIDLLPDPILIDDMIALLGALGHISAKASQLGLGDKPERQGRLTDSPVPRYPEVDRPVGNTDFRQ